MNKTNFHTHHYLCGHADGNASDYVLEAIKNGYTAIGISDHGPLPNPPFPRMTIQEFENIYLKDIDDSKQKYSDKIKIYKGVEIEYLYWYDDFYVMLKNKLDYMALALHYYSGDELTTASKSSYNVNSHDALTEYTKLAVDAMSTGLFKIFVHPDMFMIGYPSFDSYAEECVNKIIEAAIKYDVALEFNAEGIRKGVKKFPNREDDYWYPNKEFWKFVSKSSVKVIVGSDCHKPHLLDDECMNRARMLANEYNLNLINSIF